VTAGDSLLKKVIIIVFAGTAMAAGFWLATTLKTSDSDNTAQIQGVVLRPARQIQVPGLTRHDNMPFTNDDLRGRWTLMFFGYTHCPDICPTTMNVLAEARQKSADDFPQVVFVSVDPQRDTLDKLGDYVHYFDPEFIGVTGDEKMIQALALQASVLYMKVPGESGNANDYLVDHSSSILLINPEVQLAAILKAPHTPGSIIDSVNKVVR
jgi:protein SCO1/2